MSKNQKAQMFRVFKRDYLNDGLPGCWSYDIEEVNTTDIVEGFIGTYEECCNFKKQCELEDEREYETWHG